MVRLGIVWIAAAVTVGAQDPLVAFRDPVIVLEHVRVIDGTGAPTRPDETIVIDHGRISALGPASSVAIPPSARVLDLKGYTIHPGLVGMHEHLFYLYPAMSGLPVLIGQPFSAPRLYLSREALAGAIEEAHRRGLKITGHLCTVGFTEAANLGIDDLEHGLLVDSEFTPGKQPDVSPNQLQSLGALKSLDVKGPELQKLIHTPVEHKVAITSTLAVFEASLAGHPPLEQRMLDALSPQAAAAHFALKDRAAASPFAHDDSLFKKEMQFERAFVAAGGLLLAGCDPTGNGGTLPGFGDQRNLELLVDAGFKPEEAIRIYTQSGAEYLGRAETLAPGKQADIVVVEGDPSLHIADVEKVKWVFRNGVGYDSARLIDSVHGLVQIG